MLKLGEDLLKDIEKLTEKPKETITSEKPPGQHQIQ